MHAYSEATDHYFHQAASILGLTDNMRVLLATPDRELRVEVAIELDSGQIGNFIGYPGASSRTEVLEVTLRTDGPPDYRRLPFRMRRGQAYSRAFANSAKGIEKP